MALGVGWFKCGIVFILLIGFGLGIRFISEGKGVWVLYLKVIVWALAKEANKYLTPTSFSHFELELMVAFLTKKANQGCHSIFDAPICSFFGYGYVA